MFEIKTPITKDKEMKDEEEKSADEPSDESDSESDSEDESGVTSEKEGKPPSEEDLDDDNNDVPQETSVEKPAGKIYHESKLEEVFRKARDSGEGGGFQVSSMFGEQPDEMKEKEQLKTAEEATGSFSFNFAVAPVVEDTKKSTSAEEGFSFGFDVDAGKSNLTSNPDAEKCDEAIVNAPESESPTRKRRRGLMQRDDVVVDKYYQMFFELNDGLAIQGDPEGFRNDESVRTEWKGERNQLTQDWKRKRKYALSRLQKKNKFR